MKTIVWLHNGHSKVLRGRFGGYEKGRHICSDDYTSRRPIIDRIGKEEARLEIAQSLDNFDPEGFAVDMHPHDLSLPNLSLVRSRLLEGDRRCGITEVLHGALGVAQWGGKRIEFTVRPKDKTLDIRVDESGRITAAHYG